jgi:alpha-beta hydrolase superfamily lysophospholipase
LSLLVASGYCTLVSFHALRHLPLEVPDAAPYPRAIAVLSTIDVRSEDVKPAWPIPQGIKWETVNGYPIAYREGGTGTPVVLVHGAMADYRAWNILFDQFSTAHRVIAVSLRHSFPEQWNGVGDDFSTEQHAQDVAALIKKLGLGKVHLLGHSRGGGVAVEVAKS